MTEEIKEMLDTPIFIIDNEGFTIYINDKIENYITNLQKENENLKSVMFTGRNYNEVLKSEQDYKSRNEKAIEYIENPNICIDIRKTDGSLDYISTDILLNILEGGDE